MLTKIQAWYTLILKIKKPSIPILIGTKGYLPRYHPNYQTDHSKVQRFKLQSWYSALLTVSYRLSLIYSLLYFMPKVIRHKWTTLVFQLETPRCSSLKALLLTSHHRQLAKTTSYSYSSHHCLYKNYC